MNPAHRLWTVAEDWVVRATFLASFDKSLKAKIIAIQRLLPHRSRHSVRYRLGYLRLHLDASARHYLAEE